MISEDKDPFYIQSQNYDPYHQKILNFQDSSSNIGKNESIHHNFGIATEYPDFEKDISPKKQQYRSFSDKNNLKSCNHTAKKVELCTSHHRQLDLVCLDCKEKICVQCSMSILHKEHNIDYLYVFSEEVDEKVLDIKEWLEFLEEKYGDIESMSKQATKIYRSIYQNRLSSGNEFLNQKIENIRNNSLLLHLIENNLRIIIENLLGLLEEWHKFSIIETGIKILSQETKSLLEISNWTFNLLSKPNTHLLYKLQSEDNQTKKILNKAREISWLDSSSLIPMKLEVNQTTLETAMCIEYIQLIIKTQDKFLIFELEKDRQVSCLKQKIFEKIGPPIEIQVLIFGRHILEDHENLSSYGIKNGSKIHLNIKCL